MNQYIITEELLQEAMENTTWGRTNQQKFRDKLTPYQSERDTVLDEKLASQYKTILMQRMDGMEEIRSKYSIAQKSCKSCSAYDLCEELRQAGEP